MSDINEWVIAVSVVSIVSGAIICLIPKSKLKKTYCALVGILMLYTVMLPIIKSDAIKFDIEGIFDSAEEVSEQFSKNSDFAVIQSAQSGIENVVGTMLDEQMISHERISVKCKTDGEQILTESIAIYVNEDVNENQVTDIVRECIGSDAEIKIIKGDRNG